MVAETYSRDRLQPALLDRLIDEEPGNRTEAPELRTINKQRLRQGVLRDLTWLLNSQAALAAQRSFDPGRHAHAARSVLNFGLPPLSGKLVSRLELADLERMLRQALIDFEPRILPETLVVRGLPPTDPLGHHNLLTFEITGHLWAQPYPLELLLKTDLDLETGLVELRDRGAAPVKRLDSDGQVR